ncbi:CYFA0S01e11738g1_1 [Cyberlindnera fabianii]|uniref:Transcription initiation factor TFIID subunit 8 n=1 Tax=Cyberlindnera fabianii TaxID=36022 RepID=A0A061AK82_CYBFA|nr:CYFA0S01e11738g1_1 [Cyberlindnera fabianii]
MSVEEVPDSKSTTAPPKVPSGSPVPRSAEGLIKLETRKRTEGLNPMEIIAQRSIALHLHSLGIKFTPSALEQLFDLMELHLDTMLSDLQKVTQTQRRAKASPKDLRLLLKDYDMRTGTLEEEFDKTRKMPPEIIEQKIGLEKLAEEAKNEDNEAAIEPDSHNPAFVFFTHDESIVQLIPPTNKGNAAILPWLPQLPPDHTYRQTPNFTPRITDQKVVRSKLFEESKLGEKALDNLTAALNNIEEDESIGDADSLTPEQREETELGLSNGSTIDGSEPRVDYDIFDFRSEKFDMQLYAKARLQMLERRKKRKLEEEEEHRKKFDPVLTKAIIHLSPYAEDDEEYTGPSTEEILDRQFRKALHTFKSLKQRKLERQEQRKILAEEAKKKKEELAKQKATDFNSFENFENFENLENFENFGSFENSVQDDVVTFGGDIGDDRPPESEAEVTEVTKPTDGESESEPIGIEALEQNAQVVETAENSHNGDAEMADTENAEILGTRPTSTDATPVWDQTTESTADGPPEVHENTANGDVSDEDDVMFDEVF